MQRLLRTPPVSKLVITGGTLGKCVLAGLESRKCALAGKYGFLSRQCTSSGRPQTQMRGEKEPCPTAHTDKQPLITPTYAGNLLESVPGSTHVYLYRYDPAVDDHCKSEGFNFWVTLLIIR